MNNYAAIGYMIIAARYTGLDESQIKLMEAEMKAAMDEHSESEAEEAYRQDSRRGVKDNELPRVSSKMATQQDHA